MLQYDFEASVGYWIFSTAHALHHLMNEELAAHGITLRQWEVLVWLSIAGELAQNELAHRMHIEAPTLVGVLDRMERDGWIQRIGDVADRRRKLIRPTEQVEPVWAKMVQCARHVRTRATRGIPDEKLQTVRDVLALMRDNLSAASDPLPPPGDTASPESQP